MELDSGLSYYAISYFYTILMGSIMPKNPQVKSSQPVPEPIPEIVQTGHPALHRTADEIPPDQIRSPRIQATIQEMIRALESQADGVGLAAPQIGVSLRIFVVAGFVFDRLKKTVGTPHQIFINPVIVKESKEKKWMDGEGCLSVRWLYGKVKRATRVTLQWHDHTGELQSRGASGLLAHIFQHEVDHLNGIIFTEKAKDLQEFDPEEIKAENAGNNYGHFNTPAFQPATEQEIEIKTFNAEDYDPD